MCGIIGIIGKAEVTPLLIDGLKRLEYRGYDSAGVATVINGSIDRRRAEGKIARLEALCGKEPLPGKTGIEIAACHGVMLLTGFAYSLIAVPLWMTGTLWGQFHALMWLSGALLNVTLTPEQLMKQYLEELHDMRASNNLVVLVPTEGGTPVLNLGDLRRNMQQR